MSLLLVITTVANKDQAQALVKALIQEGRVACAQFHPIQSSYVWDGKVVSEEEFKILFKTTQDHCQTLMQRIREIHPYELPAIYALEPSACDPSFAQWVVDQTRKTSE
jgi:periplasmic divalent cation tolerance protein